MVEIDVNVYAAVHLSASEDGLHGRVAHADTIDIEHVIMVTAWERCRGDSPEALAIVNHRPFLSTYIGCNVLCLWCEESKLHTSLVVDTRIVLAGNGVLRHLESVLVED